MQRNVPIKAARIELDREGSVAAAFSVLVDSCTVQMRANEVGLRGGRNAEFLHQFRVGLRRLRSVLRIYRPVIAGDSYGRLADEMSWLSAQLGPARDWDVFLGEIMVPLLRCEASAPGLAALRRRCSAQRRHAAQAAREAIGASRYGAFMHELEHIAINSIRAGRAETGNLLALPLTAFAALRITRAEQRMHSLADSLDTADAAHRHRLRIAAKKLRYAVEFFRSLFEHKAARHYAAALAQMQDVLGKLNDCATARRLLEAVPAGRNAGAGAHALVIDWIAMQEQHAFVALDPVCKAWREQDQYWTSASPE
jgi:CHAD domain-containing protein